MKKLLFLFLILVSSLGCLAQVSASSDIQGPTVPQTPVQSVPPAPALVVPSDVALPGSGPPVGAPLTNTNTNDARNGGIVQAYSPATVVEHPVVVPNVINANNAGNLQTLNTGIGNFAGSAPAGQTGVSLADIARKYKTQPHQVATVITNDTLSQLHGGLAVSNEPPQKDVQREMAKAAAIPPMYAGQANYALPQNDAGGESAAAQPARIDQQRHKNNNPETSQSAAAPNADQDTRQNRQTGNDSSRLPGSGSELPLLALIGIIIGAGGGLYLLRR